jgi:hypothetical protein
MTSRMPKTARHQSLTNAKDTFARARHVWLFRCANRPALHAATLDSHGRNLPARVDQDGPWMLIGQLVVGPENTAHAGLDITAIKAGIEVDGVYLWNADLEIPQAQLRLMR